MDLHSALGKLDQRTFKNDARRLIEAFVVAGRSKEQIAIRLNVKGMPHQFDFWQGGDKTRVSVHRVLRGGNMGRAL